MEWSPVGDPSSGVWAPQWICVQCSRTVDSPILPGCSVNPCSQCAEVPHLVVDCAVDARWMWCFQCQRRQDFLPQSVTMESTPDPSWFSHGLLASLGSLYGWGSPPVTQPGTGSQSWLFCPLISLGCLQQSAPVVFLRTAQDPESLCLTGSVKSGLHMKGTSSNSTVNICRLCLRNVMLRWHCSRIGNVVIICQPVCKNCAPLHTSWQPFMRGCLRNAGFLNRGSVVPPTTDIDVPEAASVATNPLNPSTSPPSSARLVDNQVPPSTVSPFSLAAPPVPTQLPVPRVVSNPFVDLHPNTESSHSGPPSFSEGGPVRLTRFVEPGTHQSERKGTTAWGVWLRVDQWPTTLGRHPRLQCGVLYHVANRTLSFHGIARDAVQFLLLFEVGRILLSLSCLPFDHQVLELKLIALRPVAPSHNVRLLACRVPATSGPPGLHTTTRELQTCTFQGPGTSNTTKIPRKDPKTEKKERKLWRESEKKREILGPPTLRGPTFRGSTLRGSTLRGPTLRGPTLRGPPFWAPPFWAPPFGAPPFRASQFGAPPSADALA